MRFTIMPLKAGFLIVLKREEEDMFLLLRI
jgi:hypothetical protein